MTEYEHVTDDMEAVVESSELPSRLKTQVYETLETKAADHGGITIEQTTDIVTGVENRYLDTRVDPLEPVGTVSAQSIGEPGTQMSVPADERVVIRRDGVTDTVAIGSLVDAIVETSESRTIDDHEVARAPASLETLSLGADEQVRWKPVEEVSRHETPAELLRFELESGRTIRATKAHSFVTRRDNEVVPVCGSDLERGDWLPVVAEFDADETTAVDLETHLPAAARARATLTDGGTTTSAGGDGAQTTPLPDGPGRLPTPFPLDAETGAFIGAWLAAGSVSDRRVSVSGVDASGHSAVHAFAERFDIPTGTDERSDGDGIRLDGTALAGFIKAACTEDGETVVPGFAYGASMPFVRGLLRGYFSADGVITITDDAARATSTSAPLTAGIALLLARIGVYATLETETEIDGESRTLQIPATHIDQFTAEVGMFGTRADALASLEARVDPRESTTTDQVPNFGDSLQSVAADAGVVSDQVDAASTAQRIDRRHLRQILDAAAAAGVESPARHELERAVDGDVVWDQIASVETITRDDEYVYDLSVEGLETFTTAEGVVTHNTMNTFHYAGVAEIDVTQGLPRLIELVDARKTPDTPMMTVHLDGEYATDREKAHEVVWSIESTRILALGDVSTNVADMLVRIDLNEDTLLERWPTYEDPTAVATVIAETIEDALAVDTRQTGTVIEFGPSEPSYRELLQLVERLREIVFKGIEEVERVVIRKEQLDAGEEFVLYTEGSAFGDALEIEGVDASRTTCNNIHEIYRNLGVEAARETIIDETKNTLEEQGLDDVNVRHLMLVADIMTNNGEIESIGRHGISGSKDSVLARAAFEVTVNHLLDAAVHGEHDDLDGVIENVIAGKPISIGTGDVDLRMGSRVVSDD